MNRKIIDLHCDTVLFCFSEQKSIRTFDGHINADKLKSGGSLAQCFALFIPTHDSAVQYLHREYDPWELYEKLLGCYRRNLADCSDILRPAQSAEQVRSNYGEGYISSILTVEDCVGIDGKLERFDQVYADGVRMMTITWNYPNGLGYPNRIPEGTEADFRNYYRFRPETGNGLTEAGKEAVSRMEELGILPDVSHLSDAGFFDVADIVKGPFVASHSNARAICGCSRNLTDPMIRVIAEHGGVIGLNFCPSFLMEADREEDCFGSCEALARHARHILDVGGREVLALGTDFDGIPKRNLEIEDASGMQKLSEYMLRHGFGSGEVEDIFSGNVMRLYRETLR